MHTAGSRPPKRAPRLAPLLLPADAVLLYLAFVGALRMRLGTWNAAPFADYASAFFITVGVFLTALLLSGLYRMDPRTMHLSAFLRVSLALFFAWTVSLTLTYLADPLNMLPRSITAIHAMLSLIGILGLRAAIRYGYEHGRPAGPVAEAHPPVASHVLPDIPVEDLLERRPAAIEERGLRDYLAGRTVLVTGAGGSIGGELARQLMGLQPFRLVLVDVSEYNLFQLENQLRGRPFEGELVFRIADVRDEAIMQAVFATARPDVVLHAAAYKHVPLMERHPVEAFHNNTLATVSLLRLSEAFGTEQFVFVSTDKAVAPSSVLGATKRLAEWYVRAVQSPVERKIVRFGNVLGTQGSVVPIFREQILSGGPVRITHPEMERYFMSADEACRLILQTLLLEEAPVYTLDMGEPVRVRWLAEQMIRRLSPHLDRPVPITYTGIRPGEKLQERLWDDYEQPTTTAHPSIVGLLSQAPHSRSELDAHLAYLERLCRRGRPEALRKALFQTTLATPEQHEMDS